MPFMFYCVFFVRMFLLLFFHFFWGGGSNCYKNQNDKLKYDDYYNYEEKI